MIAKILVALAFSASAWALGSHWSAMGNGGGYSGVPPWEMDGPFYLTDPAFVCASGSAAPSIPGYREVIRLDHLGPDGCSGEACKQPIYARQSACGGTVSYIQRYHWEKSQSYRLDGDNGITLTSFNLMNFEGQLYTKQAELPDPAHLPSFKEAWCESIYDSSQPKAASFEVMIESGANGAQPTASVYWQQWLTNAQRPGEYNLKYEDKISLSRATTARGVHYHGAGFDLQVTGAPDADSKSAAVLKLSLPNSSSARFSAQLSAQLLAQTSVVCVIVPLSK